MMKRRFTILTAALALLVFLAIPQGMWGQTKITDCSEIVSGTTYYIGATVSNTDYYLSVSHASIGNPKGTSVTSTDNATTFLFEGSNNSWTLKFDNGLYVGALTNTNAEIVVAETGATFTTQNTTSGNLIQLKNGTRYIQKNSSSSLNFGSYSGNQMHIWLMEASTGPVQLAAPTLTATPSNETITLTWNTVAGASSYTIQYADNSSFTGATTITEATSPEEITGLTNGTPYYFKAMSVGDGTNYISSDYGTAVSATPSNIVKITITQEDIANFTNSYNWYSWADGGVSGQVYAYKNAGIQFNPSKDAYWIYNSTAVPGNITSIKMTKASGTDRSWTLRAGTSALTATNSGTQIGNAQTVGTSGATWNVTGDYNYFLLYVSGGSTVISSIEITYTTAPSTDPSISADDVEIAYDATSGSIMYEIENYVEGTMAATTTADWISDFTYDQVDEIGEVGFTATVNNSGTARTATVTLSYTYDSQTITKDVTITQTADPNYVMTITEARAQAEGSTVITKGVVTSIVSNTAYIQDANAAICVYGNNDHPLTSINVGDEIKVSGTLTNYSNLLEITNPTCNVLTTGNTLTPEVMTIAEILESTNQGWFIKIEGATVGTTSNNNTTLTQGGSSIVARYLDAEEGEVINLTGNIGRYNSNNQIANPSVIYDPSVSIDPATADPFTYVYSHGPSDEQLFTVTGAHLTSSDITVTVTAGSEYFEITDDETYGSTVTIASGSIISVRLKAGLESSANYEGTLTIASQGAQDVTVALTGTVTNQTYTISDLTGIWGEITFSPSATVEAGAQVTLTVVPDDAYEFVGTLRFYNGTTLIETVTNASNPYVYTMPAYNVNVAAELLAKTQYAITAVASPTEGGTVVTDETAWAGKVVEIAVEANEEYAFTGLVVSKTGDASTTIETSGNINDGFTFTMPAYPVTVTANFVENLDVTYDFTNVSNFTTTQEGSTNPSWGTNYDNLYYSNGDLITASGTNHYFFENGSCFLFGKKNALVNLPTFTNYNITEITIHTSSGGSQSVEVAIVNGDNTVVSAVTWAERDHDYTYTIPEQYQSSALSIKVTSAHNAQFTSITLVRERVSTDPYINLVIDAPSAFTPVDAYHIEFTYSAGGGPIDNVEFGNFQDELEASDFSIQFCDAEGAPLTTQAAPSWLTYGTPQVILFEPDNTISLDVMVAINESAEPRYCYFKVCANDGEAPIYSDLVTVHQAGAPQSYDLTVSELNDNVAAIFVFDDPNGNPLITDGAAGTVQVLEGTEIIVSPDAAEGYVISSLFVDNVDVTGDMDESGAYTFTMPASAVTITAWAQEYVAPANYVRILDLSQLTDGSKVVIAARYDGVHPNGYYAMPAQTSGRPGGVAFTSVTSDGNEILPAAIVSAEDTYYWTVNVTDDGYTFTNKENQTIAYGTSGTEFGGNNTVWSITRETASEGAMVGEYTGFVIRNGNTETRAFAFASANNNFGAYATSNMTNPSSASGYNFCLDFFVQAEVETYDHLTITGYNNDNVKDGYHLIASPVYVDPANVAGMTTGNIDLYYFDEAQNHEEWRNYEAKEFNLVPGKGYLYAKKATQETSSYDFTLTGVPYDGDGVIGLTYTTGNEFAGWNLVGNPFGSAATINKAYYAMNDEGSGFEPKTQNDQVAVMQGVFVVYTEEASTVTFTKIEDTPVGPEPETNMIINITKERGTAIDRAIVRFGQSDQLPKFMFNPDASKLYIPQGNKEFAVVNSANEGEMPVNFKAAQNGTYTFSVEPKNVEMTYLHLFDNKTGADVDLLATPSYTFEASNDDYESRFRLVFKANADVEENAATETFAYFNGSEWVINTTGNATLQVVDMMGRVLSSEQINGNTAVNLNQAAGIYMLRLVNGENVMVQKVVVK